jgi:D-tyrosyl-tRNA(Tyr) deacylase
MQVGGLEKLVSSYTADVVQVAREHVDLLRGSQLVVNQYDNHAVHVQGHEDYAKSPRFRSSPDEQQEALIAHINQHKAEEGANAGTVVNPGGPPSVAPPGGTPPPTASTVPTYPSGNPVASEPDPGLAAAA